MGERKFSFKCYTNNGTGFNPVTSQRENARRWRERQLAAMKEDPNHRFHGTNTGYRIGCRCDRCKAAGSIANKEQVKKRTKLQKKKRVESNTKYRQRVKADCDADPNSKYHGTITGYNAGCRCERCKAAYREKAPRYRELSREARAARKAYLEEHPEDPTHGTTYGYHVGCRCDLCRAANKKYEYERQRRKDESKKCLPEVTSKDSQGNAS